MSELVGIGGDLEPDTILHAYRNGLFPMPVDDRLLGWWSPNPRGVLEPGHLHVSRSLRRSMRRFEIRYDTAFDAVVAGCANPDRPGAWITGEITAAYQRLFELGWAHSVETWLDGELVGGLYGLSLGGLFAAESKFHTVTDASKAALVGLVNAMTDGHARLIDVQWQTPHLASLGVTAVRRRAYQARLPSLLATPAMDWGAKKFSKIDPI